MLEFTKIDTDLLNRVERAVLKRGLLCGRREFERLNADLHGYVSKAGARAAYAISQFCEQGETKAAKLINDAIEQTVIVVVEALLRAAKARHSLSPARVNSTGHRTIARVRMHHELRNTRTPIVGGKVRLELQDTNGELHHFVLGPSFVKTFRQQTEMIMRIHYPVAPAGSSVANMSVNRAPAKHRATQQVLVRIVKLLEVTLIKLTDPRDVPVVTLHLDRGQGRVARLAFSEEQAKALVKGVQEALCSTSAHSASHSRKPHEENNVGKPKTPLSVPSRSVGDAAFVVPVSVLPPAERTQGKKRLTDKLIHDECFVVPVRQIRHRGPVAGLRDLFEREPDLARHLENRMSEAFRLLATDQPISPEMMKTLWKEMMVMVLGIINVLQHWQTVLWRSLLEQSPIGQVIQQLEDHPPHKRQGPNDCSTK